MSTEMMLQLFCLDYRCCWILSIRQSYPNKALAWWPKNQYNHLLCDVHWNSGFVLLSPSSCMANWFRSVLYHTVSWITQDCAGANRRCWFGNN